MNKVTHTTPCLFYAVKGWNSRVFFNAVWRGVETYVAKLDTEIRDFQSFRELLVTCTLKLEELGIFCKHVCYTIYLAYL